jgi:hypothetical protein
MDSEIDHHLPESDEKQLCVSCMAPNEPDAHFCAKCGAPLSSYASTGPFESLFAEGAVYREAADRPRSLVVVIGIWLIFGMMIVGGVFFTAMGLVGFGFSIAGGIWSLIGVSFLAVSVTMIWKTTRNYLARKQIGERHDA